jgi:hypothetical protein
MAAGGAVDAPRRLDIAEAGAELRGRGGEAPVVLRSPKKTLVQPGIMARFTAHRASAALRSGPEASRRSR